MKRYGISIQVNTADEAIVTRRPNWFERVILRRKPEVFRFDDAAKRFAAAQRADEERLIRDIFENGKS